jgi:hypothetical protein
VAAPTNIQGVGFRATTSLYSSVKSLPTIFLSCPPHFLSLSSLLRTHRRHRILARLTTGATSSLTSCPAPHHCLLGGQSPGAASPGTQPPPPDRRLAAAGHHHPTAIAGGPTRATWRSTRCREAPGELAAARSGDSAWSYRWLDAGADQGR